MDNLTRLLTSFFQDGSWPLAAVVIAFKFKEIIGKFNRIHLKWHEGGILIEAVEEKKAFNDTDKDDNKKF